MKSSASEPGIRSRSHDIERIFDRLTNLTLPHGTVQYFCSVYTNLERLYFRTVKVVPCGWNT